MSTASETQETDRQERHEAADHQDHRGRHQRCPIVRPKLQRHLRPVASDVDRAGNDGNGPVYVEGPVRVIGDDIYDLDRDGDGIGCD